jgi:hypothetical protein
LSAFAASFFTLITIYFANSFAIVDLIPMLY